MKTYIQLMKIYKSSKKNILFLTLIGCIIGIIPHITQSIFASSEVEAVSSAIELYGDYALRIDKDNNIIRNTLEQCDRVKSIKECEWEVVTSEDSTIFYYYGKDKEIQSYGLQLEKGEMPNKENEILIDKKYMSENNYDYNIIGKSINIKDSDGKIKNFYVKGVINKNDAFEKEDTNEFSFWIYKKNNKPNSVYVTFYTYDNLDEDFEYISTITKEKIYPNWGIYLRLGYIDGNSIFNQYNLIYNLIFIFIGLCICFIIYNLAKVCIYDSYEGIKILNVLGVRKKVVVLSFIIFQLLFIIAGIFFGVIISSIGIVVVHILSYGNLGNLKIVMINYSSMRLFKSITVFIFACIVTILPVITKLYKISPNMLMNQTATMSLENKKKKRKNIFQKSGKTISWRIAKHNLYTNKIMCIFSIFGIALGTCMIVVALFYLKTNYSSFAGNRNTEYKISLYDFWSDNSEEIKESKKLYDDNLGFDESVKLHSVYQDKENIVIPKKALSQSYLKFLSQDSKLWREIQKDDKDTLELNAIIMGYTNEELKELYKLNHITDDTKLGEGEIVIVNNVFSISGNEDVFENNFKENDKIKINFNDMEKEDVDVTIKHCVEELTVYPDDTEYNIVVIMNADNYERIFEEYVPQYVLIHDKIEENDLKNYEALRNLLLKKYIEITYPHQNYLELQRINRILKIFVYILFSICILTSVILILSSYYLRVHIKKIEFAMMSVIGFRNYKIKKIVLFELVSIFISGQLLAVIISYFATKQIYLIKYPAMGNFLYHFPIRDVSMAILLGLFISVGFWGIILKKVEKILCIKTLKSE